MENSISYIPCLRWNQGEYQAILNIKSETKNNITPLIEVSEIKFDFEKQIPKKTIDEHLDEFAKRIKNKWGTKRCYIDPRVIPQDVKMNDGRHHVEFIFEDLCNRNIESVLVTGTDSALVFNENIKKMMDKHKLDLCFRLKIENIMKKDFKMLLDELLDYYSIIASDVDLIIDLGSPDYPSIDGFTKAIELLLKKFPYYNDWKSVVIMGTSIPQSMAGVQKPIDYIKRNEWLLYKKLIKVLEKAKLRLPNFGDYTITHPTLLQLDLRKIKTSAKIIYTCDDHWCIAKGKSTREKNGFAQFKDLSEIIINEQCYLGKSFSFGSNYIYDCAKNGESTGNLTTWKKVGTNHHIEKVVHDISNSLFS